MTMAEDAVTGNGTTDEVRDDDAGERVDVVETPAAEPEPAELPQPPVQIVPYEPRHAPLVPGTDMPIIPAHQEMQGLAAMAVTLAGANAVPAALRNAPNDVFQILLTARDIGVAITTAIREFHVIDGKVTLSPKVRLALVNERGRREGWATWPDPDNDDVQATWYATRADRPGLTFSSTFTMAEAESIPHGRSGGSLADKDNWKNYPKRMLSWRALGYLLDDVFPEVATGLYSPDELGAMTDDEGNVIDIESTEPLPGTKRPRGHGPKPPNPGDAPLIEAEPDKHAALKQRTAAISAAGDAARTALLGLWTERDDNDVPRLPPLDRLAVREHNKAVALVKSIEARIRKGEFGAEATAAWQQITDAAAAQSAATESGGAEPPAEPERSSGDESTESGDAAAGEQTPEPAADAGEPPKADTPPVSWSSDTELMQLCVDEVKSMKLLTAVQRQLTERDIEPAGNPQNQRRQLALALYAERGGKVDEPRATAHEMPPAETAEPTALPLDGAGDMAARSDAGE